MLIAEVCPVTRIRRAVSTWSYSIPDSLAPSISVGALVEIPFSNRYCLGVVWSISTTSPVANSKPISKVFTPGWALLTPAHLDSITAIAAGSYISLPTTLYTWLPSSLRQYPLTKPVISLLSCSPQATNPGLQHCIVLPTWAEFLHQKSGTNYIQFAKETDKEELNSWLSIRAGNSCTVYGKDRAIKLPYTHLHSLTVAQPEDASYIPEQAPRLHLVTQARIVAAAHKATCVIKSQLPPTAAQQVWGSNGKLFGRAPHIVPGGKTLDPAALDAIASAQGTTCILHPHNDTLIPQEDGTKVVLPGKQRLQTQVSQLFHGHIPDHIHIGGHEVISKIGDPIDTAILIGFDAIFSPTHTADLLQLIATLNRLSQARVYILHTNLQDHPLISALAAGNLNAYCTTTLTERHAASLPPLTHSIAIKHPDGSTPLPGKLTEVIPASWQVIGPFQSYFRKKQAWYSYIVPNGDMLPTPFTNALSTLQVPWQVLPTPWQVL